MTMTMPTNKVFIETIFGADAATCHVTDFTYAPDGIPSTAHLTAWKGDYFSRYRFNAQPSNQYFTISTFYPDEKNVARRRKALFKQTHCIVLDDVKEKLVQSEVDKLPKPSWVLESSAGSEQWGYILDTPSLDRHRVENLLDGLIANGLAPEGKDSGMKGVTRYVRLPDGVNNKTKKLVDGQPYNCRILAWNPFNRVTMEQLAAPLKVDLDAIRREGRVDGAAAVSDHPILEVTDIIHVKEVRSDGRFDITCPWVGEHTGQDDSGSAIFTNDDGTIGFKCHHGNCQEKTGADLLRVIEAEHTGFKAKLSTWQVMRSFGAVTDTEVVVAEVSPMVAAPPLPPTQTTAAAPAQADTIPAPVQAAAPPADVGYSQLVSMLRAVEPNTEEQRRMSREILKAVDSAPAIDKINLHEQIRTIMGWSKPDFKTILNDERKSWYEDKSQEVNFFDDVVFIAEQNQFFDRRKRMFYTPDAYQNTYSHLSGEARKEALEGGRVTKVDRLDFAPLKPPVFEEEGITYANSWHKHNLPLGMEGDASPWLDHMDRLGWGEYKKHILQWMAFTLKHPDQKINHMMILGGLEGSGKDYLLAPLTQAMKQQYHVISGETLLSNFNEYLMSTKYLHINECEMGDRHEAKTLSNKLKPLAAAPPRTLDVNPKGVKAIQIRNIVNTTMTTNSITPLRVNGHSRRMFCLWSYFDVKGRDGNVLPEWQKFWDDHWAWMDGGGAEVCIWYLRNCVDLSDFNAGAPPPVTDFLRDIVEDSKSPMQQCIETLIREEFGSMGNDLVTVKEVHAMIQLAYATNREYVQFDATKISLSNVKNALSISLTSSGYKTPHGVVFAVQNRNDYLSHSTADIAALYQEEEAPIADPTVVGGKGNVVTFTPHKLG